jgi:hypothetical protein
MVTLWPMAQATLVCTKTQCVILSCLFCSHWTRVPESFICLNYNFFASHTLYWVIDYFHFWWHGPVKHKYTNGLYESPLEEIERSNILKIFVGKYLSFKCEQVFFFWSENVPIFVKFIQVWLFCCAKSLTFGGLFCVLDNESYKVLSSSLDKPWLNLGDWWFPLFGNSPITTKHKC